MPKYTRMEAFPHAFHFKSEEANGKDIGRNRRVDVSRVEEGKIEKRRTGDKKVDMKRGEKKKKKILSMTCPSTASILCLGMPKTLLKHHNSIIAGAFDT